MLTRGHLVIIAASLAIKQFVGASPATPTAYSHDINRNLTILPTSVPKAQTPPSSSPPILYTWSDDPICASTATKASCAAAYATICTSGKLDKSMKHTVDECTVWYWFDSGNTVPTPAQCSASYTEILATHNGFGSLGYNAEGTRTAKPLYAMYPEGGNGNCFKAPGDTSAVLPMDILPDGKTSLKKCGRAKSQRDLEERGLGACIVENLAWQTFCNGVCLTTVVGTSWLTGPFAVAGWLSCLGGCDYTGLKVSQKCMKGVEDEDGIYGGRKLKRADPPTSTDKCANLQRVSFQCPAWKAGLKSEFGCEAKNGQSASLKVT